MDNKYYMDDKYYMDNKFTLQNEIFFWRGDERNKNMILNIKYQSRWKFDLGPISLNKEMNIL